MVDQLLPISIEEAKDILHDILEALLDDRAENQFQAALREAANDMVKYMRVVFPLATKVQMAVLGKHGYGATGEEMLRFTRLVKEYSRHDQEIFQLNSKLRSLMLPHMDIVQPPNSNSRRL